MIDAGEEVYSFIYIKTVLFVCSDDWRSISQSGVLSHSFDGAALLGHLGLLGLLLVFTPSLMFDSS